MLENVKSIFADARIVPRHVGARCLIVCGNRLDKDLREP